MPKGNKDELLAQLLKARDTLDVAIGMINAGTSAAPPSAISQASKVAPNDPNIDFGMPPRAFFNKYAKDLSGPERFALVVAYLSKGDTEISVTITDIEDLWKKTTALLGAFNYAHSTRAKDRDLVNTIQKGTYRLRPNWRTVVG